MGQIVWGVEACIIALANAIESRIVALADAKIVSAAIAEDTSENAAKVEVSAGVEDVSQTSRQVVPIPVAEQVVVAQPIEAEVTSAAIAPVAALAIAVEGIIAVFTIAPASAIPAIASAGALAIAIMADLPVIPTAVILAVDEISEIVAGLTAASRVATALRAAATTPTRSWT